MKISVELFESIHEPAVAAFNQRMRLGHAPSAFLLPERARPSLRSGDVTVSQYVAVDDRHEVRGGMLCMGHPAVLEGAVEPVVNIQAPLSEGIVDPAFTFVGSQLLKHVVRTNPHAFVVGMGSATNPLPRLLKAMGWTLHISPFYFRLLRAGRCVRQLGPLRNSPVKRVGATIAAATGAAAIGAAIVHRASSASKATASAFEIVPVTQWSGEADVTWDAFRQAIGFGVLRTTTTLPYFYRIDGGGPRAWWLTRGGRIDGWFGLLVTRMHGNAYFGDLVVATLTDCVGTPDAVRAGVMAAVAQAKEAGADLVITNQQHAALRQGCLEAGFREGPSNYLVATSRVLSSKFQPDRAYVTRRDGDGLTNLSG